MKATHTLFIALVAAALGAQAQTAPATGTDHSAHHPAGSASPQNDGEVRKVDKEQAKVTLRHGPLQKLDMPAMTMVFKVADPKMLDALKVGDKVKFAAEKVDGAFVVTAIQSTK
ncbi:copper-binding protein [Aquabacterium sp.]|uniref:copper-binding protein n=1 Tax=Aquabacterium sp. TaxID=1872578 RepID=UPI002CC6FACA|nr:copper-binding protein [Aquabacterium sp.]HSW08011.1 copper-binding protein [Aquabacterium sp.]